MNKKLIVVGSLLFLGLGLAFFWDNLTYYYYDFKEYRILRNKIIWQPDIVLQWDDFIYDPEKELSDNVQATIGYSSRYHIIDNSLIYRSRTVFTPSKSFVSDTTYPISLRIANAKFDLCEVYRKRLERKVDEFRKDILNRETIDSIEYYHTVYYEKFEKEWQEFLKVPESKVWERLRALEHKNKLELNN